VLHGHHVHDLVQVGIEDVDDLIANLNQSLRTAPK
jgi:O-acetylhomoserine/O-acetylserine sulfhydrylase-like pyridoxal-dependent enzyme